MMLQTTKMAPNMLVMLMVKVATRKALLLSESPLEVKESSQSLFRPWTYLTNKLAPWSTEATSKMSMMRH